MTPRPGARSPAHRASVSCDMRAMRPAGRSNSSLFGRLNRSSISVDLVASRSIESGVLGHDRSEGELAAGVDLLELDLDLLADLEDVVHGVDSLATDELAHLGDVQQTVLAREQGDEGAEGRGLDHGAHETLAHLGHRRVGNGVDHGASGLGRRAIGGTDVDRAVVLDRDLGAGLVLDLVDHLALRPDDLTDLVHGNGHADHARSELAHLVRDVDGLGHDVQDVQASVASLHILDVMAEAIDIPDEMSEFAPRVISVTVPVDKIGEVIGPKGKMINQIQDETGAQISIEDDGTIYIGATDGPSAEAARAMINAIANPTMPEVGERFMGTVVKTTTFGAFVSLLPGKDGLLHISEVRKLVGGKRIDSMDDVLKIGQKIQVELKEIDPRGKLSLAAVMAEDAALNASAGDEVNADAASIEPFEQLTAVSYT